MLQKFDADPDRFCFNVLASSNGSLVHPSNQCDVTHKTCFADFDTIACVRSAALCLLFAVTALLCVGQLIRMHLSAYSDCPQYLMFYLAVVQCVMSTVEFVIGWTPHASLVCSYLQCLLVLVIAFSYVTILCQLHHLYDELYQRLILLVAVLFFIYFSTLTVLGFTNVHPSWCACFLYQWVGLASGNAILIQVLAVVLLILNRKIDAVSTAESLKRSRKHDLFLLVVVFELSALSNLTYHLTVKFRESGAESCSEVFLHIQIVYSTVKFPVEVFSFLLPVWALLFVYRNSVQNSPGLFSSGSSSSLNGLISDPAIVDPTLFSPTQERRFWRRQRSSINTRPMLSETFSANQLFPGTSSGFGGGVGVFRRQRHFPTTVLRSGRRCISTPSIRRCTPSFLAPIPEELNSGGRLSPGNSPPSTSSEVLLSSALRADAASASMSVVVQPTATIRISRGMREIQH